MNSDFNAVIDAQNKGSNDILVEKGHQIHVVILSIVAVFSVIYSIVNLVLDKNLQALICICLLPHTFVMYLLYRNGYKALSKIINLFVVVSAISMLSFIAGKETFVLAFIIPVMMSTLIVFQGNERKMGYVLALIVLIIYFLVILSDFRMGPNIVLTREELEIEWIMNLSGTVLVVCFELIIVLLISKRIQDDLLLQKLNISENNEKLSNTVDTRDKLISILSHDLRSPLILISSGLKMVESKLVASDQKVIVNELKNRSDLALGLLDNMLLWSKNQSDKLQFKAEKLALSDIRKMTNNLLLLQGVKQLDFEIRMPATGFVHADRNMLDFILRNLISNAVKFTPDKGRILIQVEDKTDSYRFVVRDSGVGIPPDRLEQIKKGISFTTLGTAHEKGHGIGLNVISDFLHRHGSALEVNSTLGKGTEFWFVLQKELKDAE
jgi:signal transduction histidine kinase